METNWTLGIAETLQLIKDNNEIFILELDGKPLGLRVKTTERYDAEVAYYDFTLDTVKENKEAKEFINSIKGKLTKLPLMLHEGSYVTQEELDGARVECFTDADHAAKVIMHVKAVYDAKE